MEQAWEALKRLLRLWKLDEVWLPWLQRVGMTQPLPGSMNQRKAQAWPHRRHSAGAGHKPCVR